MPWLYYFGLLAVLLVGLFVNILGLPGLWLMVGAYAAYGWVTGWDRFVGWPSLIVMLVLAVLAEAVEFLAGAAGSAAAGGRKRGMIGAVVGGFLGAIFLSIIPIPIVAQIIGACLGAFVGAAVMEFYDRDVAHSIRVGVGAAKGRFWGIVSKSGFGFAMLLLAVFAAVPFGAAPAPMPPVVITPGLTTPMATTVPVTTEPATRP